MTKNHTDIFTALEMTAEPHQRTFCHQASLRSVQAYFPRQAGSTLAAAVAAAVRVQKRHQKILWIAFELHSHQNVAKVIENALRAADLEYEMNFQVIKSESEWVAIDHTFMIISVRSEIKIRSGYSIIGNNVLISDQPQSFPLPGELRERGTTLWEIGPGHRQIWDPAPIHVHWWEMNMLARDHIRHLRNQLPIAKFQNEFGPWDDAKEEE
jgi:hypothetical protein